MQVDGLPVEKLLVSMISDNPKAVQELGLPLVSSSFEALIRSWNNRSYTGFGTPRRGFDAACSVA